MPSISAYESFPEVGGLLNYGANINMADQMRQAAGYVDRIRKGTKPANMPIERAGKYALVIDRKAAKRSHSQCPCSAWDIDPARVMRPRFADAIRASSPFGLREQAGHTTASAFYAARSIFSCQAGAIHT